MSKRVTPGNWLYRLISLALSAAFLFPVVVSITSSFMSPSELSEVYDIEKMFRLIPNQVTGENYYQLLFASDQFLSMFWNSLFIAVVITMLNSMVSLIMAYVFAKLRFRGRMLLLYLYTVIMLMPYQVTLLPNYLMSQTLGIYDTWAALILPATFSPLGTMILYLFMLRIDDDVLQAALLETSAQWHMMTRVILPQVRSGLVVVGILTFAEAWNMVEQPLILLEDEWKYPLSLALNSIRDASPGTSFSGAVLYALPIILIYALCKDELFDGLRIKQ